MKPTKVLLVLAVSSLIFTSGSSAQIPTESALADNTARLRVTVRMDRDVYFPGELFDATFEVTNPMGSPLFASEPFQSTGCVWLFRKEEDRLVVLGGPHDCRQDGSGLPATTFGPGESRKEVLRSYGESFWHQLTGGGGAPDRAGTYVLQYGYGAGAAAEFTVVSPKLEADTVARVKDLIYSDRPGGEEPHPIPDYVHVIALRWQDQTYICVSQSDRTNLERDLTKKADELNTAGVGPYKRVATSQDSVVSLSATADPGENLTIEWKTSSGGHGEVYYSASYVVREANERLQKRIREDLDKEK